KFRLTNAAGQPIAASVASALASASRVRVTLAGPGIAPLTTACGFDRVAGQFTCNVKPPKSLRTGTANPYTLTVEVNAGTGFVTTPAVGAGASNPETIFFA